MTERLKIRPLVWLQRILCMLLIYCAAYGQALKAADTKPLRTVALTAEQNRLLIGVQEQMNKLEQQFRQLQARQQGILDTIAAEHELGAAVLNEIKPGEFELRETPPKAETKDKTDKPDKP